MAVLDYEQVIDSQSITSDVAYDALMGRQELQRIVELEHGIYGGETTQNITKGRMQYIHVVNEYVEPKSDDPYLNESFRRFDLLNEKADDIQYNLKKYKRSLEDTARFVTPPFNMRADPTKRYISFDDNEAKFSSSMTARRLTRSSAITLSSISSPRCSTQPMLVKASKWLPYQCSGTVMRATSFMSTQ